jgi:Protein of unknown function (DUF2505)
MARHLDYTITFDAPAEKIYADLIRREYWQSLMDAIGFATPHAEITSFSSGEGGTEIVFSYRVPRSNLPPIARTVMPVDMVVIREQHFDPYDHELNRATGAYSASVPRGPVQLGGESLLTETDTGSQLRFTGVCKVHIPFVGGALEDLILHHIKQLFDAEEAFAADWIAEHH